MSESIRKTFNTAQESHLVVDNIQGPITIAGWDQPQIEVFAAPDQDWVQVEIDQQDNKVVARTKAQQGPDKWMNWFNTSRTPRVEYDIHVPYTSDLEIKNVKGPIHIDQCSGAIQVHSVDGNITLDQVRGDVHAETVNGKLSVSHLQGQAHLKTVNGKLNLEDSTLSGLHAHTVNGKIEAEAEWDADAQITLDTVNGNCDLTVPADFRALASAHGVNASVTYGQTKTVQHPFGGWQGTIGPKDADEPKAKITFHTINGHLRINDSGPPTGAATEPAKETVEDKNSAPAEPEAESIQAKAPKASPDEMPGAAESPKTQLEILQMVERGEMTVQEAVKMLET